MAPSVSGPSPANVTEATATPATVAPAGNANTEPSATTTATTTTNNPPTKTDKPRPHVCNVCQRSFARLEHLKRHERSHTKEKPFDCQECTRAFARRDLLLRHQQKLHKQGETTGRLRAGRRESTTGAANGANRVRKNSTAGIQNGIGMGGMRPRANTISHIDGGAFHDFMAQNGAALGRNMPLHNGLEGHSRHASLAGLPGGFDYRGIPNNMGAQHTNHHGLPRLDTQLGMGMNGGLRTAPIGGFGDLYDFDNMFMGNSTINPAQLHTPNMMAPNTQYPGFNPFSAVIEDDDMLDWSNSLNNSYMMGGPDPMEHAIDESSPSALSTGTQSGISEVMMDGSNGLTQATTQMWHNSMVSSAPMVNPAFNLESLGAAFAPELLSSLNPISPTDMQDPSMSTEFQLSSAPMMPTMSPTNGMPGLSNSFHASLGFNPDSPSNGSSSINDSSARQSSVTSVSSDSITEATRQALIAGLSQALGLHQPRTYTQGNICSPLSSNGTAQKPSPSVSLPSTNDLQRYVRAYIDYFHPHLPFLHVATLSFIPTNFNEGTVVGGDCLLLAMAAIGALYEYEAAVGTDLFEAAKKMIFFYLEERRQESLSAATLRGHDTKSAQKAPLWLVQAMLLTLVYGHNCGDQKIAEISTTHIAALVSLTKAADLDKVPSESELGSDTENFALDDHARWTKWKIVEERKRTYYAVFILSSLLVTAYAHQPRILNSEIRLDLPCDEHIWEAESAQRWVELGAGMDPQRNYSFASALSYLLEANARHIGASYTHQFGVHSASESDMRPSTFGCYILINALHVYIWETRTRHTSHHWSTSETDQMIAQVEPALKAWQAAWRSNPRHSIERPNPYGPLSADAIPLLDCAYVRLFVDIGYTKQSIWDRDFDSMAEKLARGTEIAQGSDDSEDSKQQPSSMDTSMTMLDQHMGIDRNAGSQAAAPVTSPEQSSKRERHLRKAAFYAADSLLMADRLGITFADFNSRELPLQSAMCTFECAQVLAEWVATVQERVGPYLGILGKDNVDFSMVPAVMLLEEEDIKLLKKLEDILRHADAKLSSDMHNITPSGEAPLLVGGLGALTEFGYGSKLLHIAAYMLEKAAVWPVTRVMARALQAHANHMQRRSEASTTVS